MKAITKFVLTGQGRKNQETRSQVYNQPTDQKTDRSSNREVSLSIRTFSEEWNNVESMYVNTLPGT